MAGSLVHLSRTPDHPPYAEMISDAIMSLGEECGSSESSISTYIKSNHQDLPVAHSNLLSYHLSKLIRLGEIDQSTPNSYSVSTDPTPKNPNPNPSPPPRRGRSHSKNPNPNPSPPPPPRRGRPPKTETLKNRGSERRRSGKPPERKPDRDEKAGLLPGAAAIDVGDVPLPLPRRRGRPPKRKNACAVGPSGVGSEG
ncbi:HMG-Y-related protein A-like [Magnolia sinica]|uniref:HMG-Y-related protein A-like n=1 Tax=Magnolia sinica TaxID=86752 RepID=UPI00265B3FBD|nr:HMG-Y-related protein A-like [Magnolia sinica]